MSTLVPYGLRCEHLVAPLNLHRPNPRLSWMLRPTDAGARGSKQTAFEVNVSSDDQEIWASGRVESAAQITNYAGRPLATSRQYLWKIRAWDGANKASNWSDPAPFETGLLTRDDWRASWIGADDSSCPAPLFRKRFQLPCKPNRARAYLCGLGYHELYLNGRRVGDHVLDPAQTDYETRALYVAHDVTDHLVAGANAVGVTLGKGWYTQDLVWGGLAYGQPRLIFQLRVDDQPLVVSDTTWLTTPGPVLENNVYAGEIYDARRAVPQWCEAECDEAEWTPVVAAAAPTKSLEPQPMPPIRAARTLEPVKIARVSAASHVFDFGQNFAGWVRLKLPAQKPGSRVRVRTAEALAADGTLDTASTGVFATRVEQVDTFVSAGRADETYEPRFTYHGFRYAEITGLAHEPTKDTATGVAVHSDVPTIGTFECSDEALNRIHKAAMWTLLSNLHGLPTDCPAREKCGWLGDAHVIAEMALLNFDCATLLDKYVRDIETSWRGALPGHVAPGKRCSEPDGNLDWGAAVVMLPWYCRLYTGDDAFLHDHYAAMKKFLVNARAHVDEDGLIAKGYGDWCPPGTVEPTLTPVALTTTAWVAHAARILSRVAAGLGHNGDAQAFGAFGDELARALDAEFYDPVKQTYGSQTADAMAVELGFAEDPAAVTASLARDVAARDNHHATGIFGSRYLFDALARFGHGSTALAILRQTTYPSLGHLFAKGATTMWECWGEEALDKQHGARSQNHPMQAAFAAWFFQGLAGINSSPEFPGFARVELRPQIIRDEKLTWVRATHRGPRGPIVSEWRRAGDEVTWRVELPPNVEASLHVPGNPPTTPQRIASGAHAFRFAVPP